MKTLNIIHQNTYDQLAFKYDERADKLYKNNKDSLGKVYPYVSKESQILDLGCAVGSLIKILKDDGFKNVDGIEISRNMTELALKRNPGTNIIFHDFLTYNFRHKYDLVIAFAFIHLFPTEKAFEVMKKIMDILKPGGYVYIGTTASSVSSEGFESKKDYKSKLVRYRKRWREDEIDKFFQDSGFTIIKKYSHTDPYGKTWLDYILLNNAH